MPAISLYLPRPRLRLTGPGVAVLLDGALWLAFYAAYRVVKVALQ